MAHTEKMPEEGLDPADTDAALLRGGGDEFAAFYRRHERAILSYFRHRTRDAELIADLTAETFAQALASREMFRGEGPARAWLFGIASHVLSRSLRQTRVEDRARRRLGMDRLSFTDEELERVHAMPDDELVGHALLGIPESQREAVLLRVVEENTYSDIAEKLRVSEALARQRVKRGLSALRIRLGNLQ